MIRGWEYKQYQYKQRIRAQQSNLNQRKPSKLSKIPDLRWRGQCQSLKSYGQYCLIGFKVLRCSVWSLLCVIMEGEMDKLRCDECGTSFNCGAPPGKDHCWCMELPNLRQSFDLAGKCVCPDCMTLGQAKDMTKARKARKSQRDNSAVKVARR